MSNFFSNFSARYCSDPQARKKWLIYGGGTTAVVIVLIIIIAVATSGGSDETSYTGQDILREVPLIDGHNGVLSKIYIHRLNQLNTIDFDKDLSKDEDWQKISLQTDIQRLKTGLVGGQFFAAHADCDSQFQDSVRLTLDQIDLFKRLIQKYPNDLTLVKNSEGISDAFRDGKIASMIGITGGHSIDSRTSILRLYYDLGVRYLTLTHNCSVPWADSSASTNTEQKISDFGIKEIIPEMNRLGMIIDLSHASKNVMDTVLEKSQSPVIFSHSSADHLTKTPLNIQNDTLAKIKDNNGLIMVNFQHQYVVSNDSATIENVINHIEFIKNKIGVEHVGIGADFDSIQDKNTTTAQKTQGLEDVTKYVDLFNKLRDKGYDRDQLRKLASENFVRVFEAVEKKSEELRSAATSKPSEMWIKKTELDTTGKAFKCRTDEIIYPKDL